MWTPSHRPRPSQSSISSLAHPLSPALTARLQSSFFLSGLSDALQFKKAIESIQLDPVIRSAVTKCTLLQMFILVCVMGVDWLLLPTWARSSANPNSRQRMTEEQARFYFQLFWLYPLIGLSFLLSGSFFSNVASRASSSDVTKISSSSSVSSNNITHKSSLLSRIIVIAVYLLTSAILSRIPILGRPLSFLYLSLISSYYCFEYRFLSSFSLFSLRSRVTYLESRWPYFIGFGLPSTILSSSLFSSTTLNLTIWSLLFPAYLLMSAQSDPLPYDPSKPAKSHDLPGQEDSTAKGTTKFASRYLNPEARLPDWWPERIWVLHPAVVLDDVLTGFGRSFLRSSGGNVGGGAKKSAEGYMGPSSANGGVQYGAAAYGGGVPLNNNNAYAQRRDAFASRNISSTNNSNFGNAASAAGSNIANAAGGFARQADQYFGNLASGQAVNGGLGSKPPPPRRERSENYGVGLAGGVSTRREGMGGDLGSGVVGRRRGAGGVQ